MKKRENGQSAVEFALVLPILLLIVCGILDFGWLFYNYYMMYFSVLSSFNLSLEVLFVTILLLFHKI